MQIAATIFIVLSVGIIVAMFVRSRAREGVPVFKLTAKDRADLQEVRPELGIRRILARLLGGFAGLCFIGGVVSCFQRDSSGRVDWTIAVVMIVLSQILLLCVWLLIRKRNDVA
jgi:hypothetical protein